MLFLSQMFQVNIDLFTQYFNKYTGLTVYNAL